MTWFKGHPELYLIKAHYKRSSKKKKCRCLEIVMADVQTTEEAAVGRTREHQEARKLLVSYLGKRMRVFLSDGRVIMGNFLCTDRDCNIVLGACEEYLSQDDLGKLPY